MMVDFPVGMAKCRLLGYQLIPQFIHSASMMGYASLAARQLDGTLFLEATKAGLRRTRAFKVTRTKQAAKEVLLVLRKSARAAWSCERNRADRESSTLKRKNKKYQQMRQISYRYKTKYNVG
jgi:hypothetical protein